MKQSDAIIVLGQWKAKGISFYSSSQLAMVFNESGPTLRSTIAALTRKGVLERIARNLYRYTLGAQPEERVVEQAAVLLRRGHYCFESLESAAAQWGAISQIPVDRLTVMTTGREGVFDTPHGTIEFVHTSAGPEEILTNTIERPDNPLPIATRAYTLKNLKTCRRSKSLVDAMESEDA